MAEKFGFKYAGDSLKLKVVSLPCKGNRNNFSQVLQEASEIYEALGMDIPTAIRMFFVRSKMVRGIPFDTTLPKDVVTRTEALSALDDMFNQAEDAPEMTLDEINAEIADVRAARKAAK